MNLWARNTGLLMMVAALLFFSCEEEIKKLGYKANSRFDVIYKELPIESSVFLTNEVNTTNYGSGDRFLIGQYQDDDLGLVSAGAYSQYFRSGSIPDSLGTAEYESTTLYLTFDYYNYGSGSTASQDIEVFTLADTLYSAQLYTPYYYSGDIIAHDQSIGTKSFSINPIIFNGYLTNAGTAKNPETTLAVDLDPNFGEQLFTSAQKLETDKDSTFYKYNVFRTAFKGLAIVPMGASNDKILGFNPQSPSMRMVVRFTKSNSKLDSLVFRFNGVSSFNAVTSEKSGTDVAGAASALVESQTLSDRRYVQNGVGIVTKLDFTSFLNFADTIPYMTINSAEIVINDVPVQTEFTKPQTGLGLRVLYPNLRFRSDTTSVNRGAIQVYKGTVSYGNGGNPVPNGYITSEGTATPLFLPLVAEPSRMYRGFTTLFMQELYRNAKLKSPSIPVFSSLALYSTTPQAGKSVDRVGFHKDNIKLRIYYTLPIIDGDK